MKFQVTFDANDPAGLADFWALALGYEIQPPPRGFDSWDDWATGMGIPEENWNDARALVDPTGEGPRIFFQRVPEGKTAKIESTSMSTLRPTQNPSSEGHS